MFCVLNFRAAVQCVSSKSLCCFQRWTDEYLVWDPAQFGGIKSLKLDLHTMKLWMPDIMLLNT